MSHPAKRVVLASRPVGEPKPSDFRIEEYTAPAPGAGEVLLRTIWLSLDPYMRGRMSDGPSYAQPVPIGGVMEGGTVSEVIASNNPGFRQGRHRAVARGLADPRDLRRPGARQDRSEDRADLDRCGRARHARHDRLHGPARHRQAASRARRSSLRPPPARSARRSDRSRRSRARVRSASPAARTSATTSRKNSASTIASITAIPISPQN